MAEEYSFSDFAISFAENARTLHAAGDVQSPWHLDSTFLIEVLAQETGERVVQRKSIGVNGRVKGSANLGIDKVSRSHIGQRLRDDHALVAPGARGGSMQVVRPELHPSWRGGEANTAPSPAFTPGGLQGQPVVFSKIGDGDRLARPVRSHA